MATLAGIHGRRVISTLSGCTKLKELNKTEFFMELKLLR